MTPSLKLKRRKLDVEKKETRPRPKRGLCEGLDGASPRSETVTVGVMETTLAPPGNIRNHV